MLLNGFFTSTITAVGMYAFDGDETRHMSRLENTHNKKTEAYTEKLKFKEKLAGENKSWMDSSKPDCYIVRSGLSFYRGGLQAGSSGI